MCISVYRFSSSKKVSFQHKLVSSKCGSSTHRKVGPINNVTVINMRHMCCYYLSNNKLHYSMIVYDSHTQTQKIKANSARMYMSTIIIMNGFVNTEFFVRCSVSTMNSKHRRIYLRNEFQEIRCTKLRSKKNTRIRMLSSWKLLVRHFPAINLQNFPLEKLKELVQHIFRQILWKMSTHPRHYFEHCIQSTEPEIIIYSLWCF